jgi:hypothetical protein
MSEGQLPTFIVIGAMKCGTSSLHEYLNRHPEVSMSTPKEPSYFVHNRGRDLEWYKDRFEDQTPIRGESSTHYTKYPIHEGVPKRMCALLPGVKLIYLVRPPVDRLLSHYVFNYARGKERRSLKNILRPLNDQNPYLSLGKYFMQIEKYLNFYSRDKIIIVESRSLKNEKEKTLKSIFDFVGADPNQYNFDLEIRKNDSNDLDAKTSFGRMLLESKLVRWLVQNAPSELVRWLEYPFERPVPQPRLSEQQRCALNEYYRQDVKHLRAFTGLALESWLATEDRVG